MSSYKNKHGFMSSNPQRLQYLFQKYLKDKGTPKEIKEFWGLFSELEKDDPIKQDLWQLWNELDKEDITPAKNWDVVIKDIHTRAAAWEKKPKLKVKQLVWRIAAAASILCLMATGVYLLDNNNNSNEKNRTTTKIHPVEKDIKPGGNKAVLILANGKTIFLDSMRQGNLVMQGNSKIMKLNSGLLAYHQTGATREPKTIQYNVLKTPRGGKYQLVLPDGSKVWLNASSSIRFPTAFTGKERKVNISGEVYFEVAANENQPFKVKSGNIEIDVLGTNFNIKAYQDEPATKITLLEGSLKVIQRVTQQSKLMKPGQQAQVNKGKEIKILDDVNTDEVMAWKNNLFWFDDDDLQTVMRQISRWYDVDVEIKGTISQHFTGSIPRDLMVSDVFKVLNKTGKVNYRIEGKKIIVSP